MSSTNCWKAWNATSRTCTEGVCVRRGWWVVEGWCE